MYFCATLNLSDRLIVEKHNQGRPAEATALTAGAHGVEGGQWIFFLLELFQCGGLEVDIENPGQVHQFHFRRRFDRNGLHVTPETLILVDLSSRTDDGLGVVREIQVVHRTGNAEIIAPLADAAGPGIEKFALDTQFLIQQGPYGRGAGEVFRAI